MMNGTGSGGKRTDGFLPAMSHEIRTPLSVIMGMCEIAGSHIDDRDRVVSCLEKIRTAADHIAEIVDMVLDMTSMENGDFCGEERRFGVGELTYELKDMLGPMALDKGVSLTVSDDGVIHRDVVGDYGSVLLVMMNLGTNAVKYTDRGGSVTLNVAETGAEEDKVIYRFSCRDNGMGISREFIGRIFEPFSRSDAARASSEGGSGLGMAIVKKTVDMLGGRIEIESREGEGTEVTVDMSLKCVEMPVDLWYNE